MDCSPSDHDRVHELDCDKMKWVSPKEKTIGEYAFFRSNMRQTRVVGCSPVDHNTREMISSVINVEKAGSLFHICGTSPIVV